MPECMLDESDSYGALDGRRSLVRVFLGHLCTAEPPDSGFEVVSCANSSVDGYGHSDAIAGDGLGEARSHTRTVVSVDLRGVPAVRSRPLVRSPRVPVQPPRRHTTGATVHADATLRVGVEAYERPCGSTDQL
jgi:hypothetical protein